MKRIVLLLLATLLAFSLMLLAACDNKQVEDETTDAPATGEPTTEEITTAPDTEADTEPDEPSDLENAAEYVRQLLLSPHY